MKLVVLVYSRNAGDHRSRREVAAGGADVLSDQTGFAKEVVLHVSTIELRELDDAFSNLGLFNRRWLGVQVDTGDPTDHVNRIEQRFVNELTQLVAVHGEHDLVGKRQEPAKEILTVLCQEVHEFLTFRNLLFDKLRLQDLDDLKEVLNEAVVPLLDVVRAEQEVQLFQQRKVLLLLLTIDLIVRQHDVLDQRHVRLGDLVPVKEDRHDDR